MVGLKKETPLGTVEVTVKVVERVRVVMVNLVLLILKLNKIPSSFSSPVVAILIIKPVIELEIAEQ